MCYYVCFQVMVAITWGRFSALALYQEAGVDFKGNKRIIYLYSIQDGNLCDEVLAFLDVLLKFWDTCVKKFLFFGRELADRVYFFNTVRLYVKKR